VLDGVLAAPAPPPSRPAVLAADRTLTWAGLRDEARAAGAALAAGPPGPVGLLLDPGADLLVAFLACLEAGRPAAVLQRAFTGAELRAAVTDAGIALALAGDEERAAALRGAGAAHVRVGVPRAGDGAGAPSAAPPSVAAGAPGGPQGRGAPAARAGEADPLFYVGFTSGSSGRPKAFARRLRSWTDSFPAASERLGIGPGDHVVLPGPLDHSLFLFGAVHALAVGASVSTHARFDPAGVHAQLAATPGASVYLVPTMVAALAGAAPLAHVRSVVAGGAKLEPHHWAAARALFPRATVHEIYGASELSFVTVADAPPPVEGCVGHPFPGVEVAIRDGVVHARSPYLFAGYLREGALVPPALTPDGFATVGDLGVLAPDGALRLTGRASNLVVTGGKNVHPEEVEAVLAGVGGVGEAAVTGRPDPYWGERLVAYLVLDGAAPPPRDAVVGALRGALAAHKVPKDLVLVDALPRTASGKLARAELARLAAAGRGTPWAAP